MKRVPGTVLCLALFASASVGATPVEEPKIHECTDSKGNVVYQDGPCPEVAPAPPKPEPQSKPPSTPKAEPQPTKAVPAPGAVDSRWSTPQNTLKTFIGAVKAGDRTLIRSCLTATALAELGPDADAIPLGALQELVGSFIGYVSEGDLGPVWSIRAKRANQRPKWIFFERTRHGDWKIAAI